MTQTFSTDWDIEKYREESEEMEEQWLLRKAFIQAHKGKIPEEYLVTLSTSFTNVELMGYSYADPVMKRIAELSKDIAKTYRARKKRILQKMLAPSSDAEENTIKKLPYFETETDD